TVLDSIESRSAGVSRVEPVRKTRAVRAAAGPGDAEAAVVVREVVAGGAAGGRPAVQLADEAAGLAEERRAGRTGLGHSRHRERSRWIRRPVRPDVRAVARRRRAAVARGRRGGGDVG